MSKSELLSTLQNRRSTYIFLSRVYAKEVSLDLLHKLMDASPQMDGALGEFMEKLKVSVLEKVRTELASNADWILYRETDGSVTAESRKDDRTLELSTEFIKETRSLMALIEGGRVTIE